MAKRSPRRPYRVFVSHSSQDRWIAKQCVRLIEEAGGGRIKAFLDENDIEGGESIPEAIRQALKQCDEFVVLLSRYSKNRPWVIAEAAVAWAYRKLIVAIIDKIDPKEMPEFIGSYKAIDLNNFDQYLHQLVKRVKARRAI